jgi:ribonuclease Z
LGAWGENDLPPQLPDRDAASERLGWELPFSEFIAGGKWDVDDVLRPIYEDAGKAMGREFKYPGDE